MMKNSNEAFLNMQYMPRPRVDAILDYATRGKLVNVVAGTGYGKTQFVRNYIEKQPHAVVRWIHFTESDNNNSYFWEHLVQTVSFDNTDLSTKLHELGFPETMACFERFAEILKIAEHRLDKTFVVLDDFHLICSKCIFTFIERYVNLQIPSVCVIIISRKEPEINTVSLFTKGEVCTITESELRFTEKEISDYLKQRGIAFSEKNLPQFVSGTKGWALAIHLLSLVLQRIPEDINIALDSMKQNIFKLMEIEAFNDFPQDVQKKMIQLSLVSDLPLASWHDFSRDTSFIENLPQLASFMWFDNFINDYRIHPLYLDFLESKQHILTYEERQDTYSKAAQWCSENNFHMDCVKYFAKSRQYDRMLEMLLSYPFKLPRAKCEYFLDILEGLEPCETEHNDYSCLMLKNFYTPLLLLWTDRIEEARDRCFDAIREWEQSDWAFSRNILYAAYSSLAYMDTYLCISTHKYTTAEYLEKATEYYNQLSIPMIHMRGSFAITDVRSFACLVGEGASLSDFDQFIETTKQTALYLNNFAHDMYYGYEDLVFCELAFYKNQLETAKMYAHEAILKAREKKQYSIEAMATFYLFHIALHEGNYTLGKEILEQGRESSSNPNFWNRKLFYNLVSGFINAQVGLVKMKPSQLAMDEKNTALEVSVPIRELIYSARFLIATKNYDRALTLLSASYPRIPQERFLFGELTLSLLTATAKIQIGDVKGAVRDFEKAYSLSFEGVFETPFIEVGKNLHPLVVAASKEENSSIPDEWLKAIDRKASFYAKRLSTVINLFKKEKNIEDTVQLSKREQEVIRDLYHGLSRDEIAITRYLSINTVHKIIQSLYIKLDAYNKADAIRIAIDKNLIE